MPRSSRRQGGSQKCVIITPKIQHIARETIKETDIETSAFTSFFANALSGGCKEKDFQ